LYERYITAQVEEEVEEEEVDLECARAEEACCDDGELPSVLITERHFAPDINRWHAVSTSNGFTFVKSCSADGPVLSKLSCRPLCWALRIQKSRRYHSSTFGSLIAPTDWSTFRN
jgi:hypothetical protein